MPEHLSKAAEGRDSGSKGGLISGSIGFSARAVTQLLLLAVTIVATRFLSVSDFGYYAIASSLLILARTLFYVGPYEYLLKTRDEQGLFSSCFSANTVLALGGSASLLLFALASPSLFGDLVVRELLIALAPSLFLSTLGAWYEAILLRRMQVRRYYLYTVTGELFGAIVSIALLISGFGVMSIVAQIYGKLLVLIPLYLIATGERPRFRYSAGVRQVLAWSSSRYASVFFNFASNYGADMILGIYLSAAATGIYRASNRIVSALSDLFAQPLQKIAQTNLYARMAKGKDADDSWLNMLSGVGAISWALLTGLGLAANDIVPFVLGPKWAPAGPLVMILCLVRAFSILNAVTNSLLVGHDRQRKILSVQICVSVMILLAAWLMSKFGVQAVTIAVGLVQIGLSFVYMRMALELTGTSFRILLGHIMPALIPSVCVALAMLAVGPWMMQLPVGSLARVATQLAVGTMGFLIGVALTRRRLVFALGHLAHRR